MLTSNISKGGLFTALCVIFIYFSNIVPNNNHAFLAICAAVIFMSIKLIGIKHSLLVYTSTVLISIFLIGININTFTFIIFFGIYGFVKQGLEKLKLLPLQYILKGVYFLAVICLTFLIFLGFKGYNNSLLAFAAFYIVLFYLFDYALTLFYRELIKRRIIKTK